MTHIARPDGLETIMLARDTDFVLDLYAAAAMVDGVTAETLPRESPEDRDAAARAYRDFAQEINVQSVRGEGTARLYPEAWGQDARRVLEAGGHVVRISVQPAGERPAEDSLSLLYAGITGIRRKDPVGTSLEVDLAERDSRYGLL